MVNFTKNLLQVLLPNSESEVVHLNSETRGTMSGHCSSQSSTKLPRSPRHYRVACSAAKSISVLELLNDRSQTDCKRTHRRRNPQKSRMLFTGKQVQGTAFTCCQFLVDSKDWTSGCVSYRCRPTSLSGQTRPSCDGEVTDTSGSTTQLVRSIEEKPK